MDNVTAQHTPGPWTIRYGTNLFSESGRLVASTGGHSLNGRFGDEHRINVANARLIAAAPELLAALNQIANEMQSASSRGRDVSVSWLDARIALARVAIAKAEGREA